MNKYNHTKSIIGSFADFKGKADRSEYWLYVVLFFFILNILVKSHSAYLYWFLLITITPTFSITVRRLHDTGKSGWFILTAIIPIIIIELIFYLSNTKSESNNIRFLAIPILGSCWLFMLLAKKSKTNETKIKQIDKISEEEYLIFGENKNDK